MRLCRTSRAAVAGLLGTLVFAAAASATPTRSASPKHAATTSCYADNEFSLVAASLPGSEFGAFSAASSGSGDGVVGKRTKHVTWDVALKVTGNDAWKSQSGDFLATKGTMDGSLTITVALSKKRTLTFTSRCVAEAVIEDDGEGDQIIEAEFEGWIGKKPVVASIVLSSEQGTVSSFSIGLEYGVTCKESPKGEISVAGSGSGPLSMDPALASGAQRGRASLPKPWTASNSCPDVFFG
jgi:hypothetical protein